MNVRFGVSPMAWLNDGLPRLGEDMSLETCLAQAREAGFSGIEGGIDFPADEEAGLLFERFGLALVSLRFSGSLLGSSVAEEKDRMQAYVAACKARDVPMLTYIDSWGSIESR